MAGGAAGTQTSVNKGCLCLGVDEQHVLSKCLSQRTSFFKLSIIGTQSCIKIFLSCIFSVFSIVMLQENKEIEQKEALLTESSSAWAHYVRRGDSEGVLGFYSDCLRS